MILASATAKAAAAGVTKAAPLQPAHQALGNHFVKTLPVLLGNEDPNTVNQLLMFLSDQNIRQCLSQALHIPLSSILL